MAIPFRTIIMAIAVSLCWPAEDVAAQVAVDENRLEDPAEEALARSIMQKIRCLVCQNQSIEDSNADLARTLRQIVRERVAAGGGETEVRAFLVERYGDWILLDPPFRARTALLWAAPIIVLLAGSTLAVFHFRRTRSEARDNQSQELSEQERKELNRILGSKDR